MEHQPLRSADVRERNQKLVLRLLFQKGPTSQSRVVQKTGLKAPTVFRIFAKLEEGKYITPCEDPGDTDVDSERKGRRPAYFCVVPSAAFAVGVDFSTAGASVVVVNFVNEAIYHKNVNFRRGIQRDRLLEHITGMVRTAVDECRIAPDRLLGIGIGAPGIVDTETGVVVEYSRIAGLTGYSLSDHFGRIFRVPVFVHNNASVIAASEYYHDTALDYDSVLAVLVRGGVGGAFINHGRIFVNGSTTALELGRTSVCRCQSTGTGSDTLESLVGEGPLLQKLQETESVGDWSEADERLAEEVIGDRLAEPAAVLATAARDLYHILHPDAILVISRYAKLASVLGSAVQRAIPESTVIPVPYDPVKACYGATDLVFQHFFAERSARRNGQTAMEVQLPD